MLDERSWGIEERRAGADTAFDEVEVSITGLPIVEAAHTLEELPANEEVGRFGVSQPYLLLVILRRLRVEQGPDVGTSRNGEADPSSHDVGGFECLETSFEPVVLGSTVRIAKRKHASMGIADGAVARGVGIGCWAAHDAYIAVTCASPHGDVIGRAVVADHDLEIGPRQRLLGKALEELFHVASPVPDRDDDAHSRRSGTAAHVRHDTRSLFGTPWPRRQMTDLAERRGAQRTPGGPRSAVGLDFRDEPLVVREGQAVMRMQAASMTAVVGVALLVVANGAGESTSAVQPGQQPSVFVATTGSDTSSCRTRREPCATFDRAYRVAAPGQIVEVAGGSYPAQTLHAASGKTAPNIIFQPARDARVILDGLEFGGDNPARGPDFVTVRGMETTYYDVGLGSRNQRGIFVGPGSSHITLEHMDAGSVDSWLADHLTVNGGDYGPCNAVAFAPNVCGNNKQDLSTNVLIVGATFHDLRMDASCFQPGADCHWECMYLNANWNLTVRNSKFYNCSLFDVFVTISGPDAAARGHKNLLFENNSFAAPWTENPGAPNRGSALALSWCQNSPEGYQTVRVRFNSFEASTGLWGPGEEGAGCTWSGVEVVGNLLQYQGSCISGATYAYNVWSKSYRVGRCSATDRIGARTFPYVAPTGGPRLDFRLTDAKRTLADNLVPRTAPGGCPARDMDRQRRPLEERCDAGADERIFVKKTKKRGRRP